MASSDRPGPSASHGQTGQINPVRVEAVVPLYLVEQLQNVNFGDILIAGASSRQRRTENEMWLARLPLESWRILGMAVQVGGSLQDAPVVVPGAEQEHKQRQRGPAIILVRKVDAVWLQTSIYP